MSGQQHGDEQAAPEPRVVGRRTLVPGPKYRYDELTIKPALGGPASTRHVVTHPGAVVVVPIMPDGRVVLVRNFRVAVEASGAWVIECCAGTLDKPGEPPIQCARRELIEETGYRAAILTPLLPGEGFFYTTPGLTSERMYPFAATALTHVGQQLEPEEAIQVLELTPREAFDRIIDAKSLVALSLAARRGLLTL